MGSRHLPRVVLTCYAAATAAAAPLNVVYILSDDMRADLGSYGLPAVTPHLDALAASGVRFQHSFCQLSVCSPSRQSFLTGRRPDRSRVWNFIDSNSLNTSAIPGHFRDHGYLALGLGKTFHEAGGAWNADAYWTLDPASGGLPYFPYESNVCPHGGEGGGHCTVPDGPSGESVIYDYRLLNATLQYLSHAANVTRSTGQPFFLMTGFRDPHAPWAAPQRMWDLYNESEIAVASSPLLGEGTPLIAWSDQLDVMLANGTSFPFSPYKAVPDWVARDQRHAYYAAISYVDEHVGQIVAQLEAEGLADSTIVVFHADHGYGLGEHGYWEKKADFDMIVRVPLIIRVPGKKAGAVATSYVDLVDIFPTLAKLAGLPPPPADTDGDDFSALFDDPTRVLKTEAFHQYPACGMSSFNETRDECNSTPRTEFNFMSYSVRNTQWRFTRWLVWNNVSLTSDWDGDYVDELYAHAGDNSTSFDAWDNVNLASANPGVVAQLAARLRAFFDRTWT